MAMKQTALTSQSASSSATRLKAGQVASTRQSSSILLIFGCLSCLSFFGISVAGLLTGHDFLGTIILACCAFGGLSMAGMVTNGIYTTARVVADKKKLIELVARQAELKQIEAAEKEARTLARRQKANDIDDVSTNMSNQHSAA